MGGNERVKVTTVIALDLSLDLINHLAEHVEQKPSILTIP